VGDFLFSSITAMGFLAIKLVDSGVFINKPCRYGAVKCNNT